jgi:hypothetical protein
LLALIRNHPPKIPSTMQPIVRSFSFLFIVSAIGLISVLGCKKKEESTPQPSRSFQEQFIMDDMLFGLRMHLDDFIIVDEAQMTGQLKHMGSRADGTPCATVIKNQDRDSIRITIDFGSENCECADGTKRRGKLSLVYAANVPYQSAGYSRFIRRDQYYVNDYWVTGASDIIFDYRDSLEAYQVNSIGLLTITHLGRQQQFTSIGQMNLLRSGGSETPTDVSDDRYAIEQADEFYGLAGVIDGAVPYLLVITDRFERQNQGTCRRHFIKGKAAIQVYDNPNFGIDFGDGSCDNQVRYTENNWQTAKTIQLP